MSCTHYRGSSLFIEKVNLQDVAQQYGTPCYVYSRRALQSNWQKFDGAFQKITHRLCFAVKANSNIAILNLLARLKSGFDIVSQGELERVLAAGGDPQKIVFSGVGKKPAEIDRAIKAGIYCFNVESEPEVERIHAIASKLNSKVNIALRINPNIDASTHAHISTGMKHNKFGIDSNDVLPLCQKIITMPWLNLIGLASHIGSQIIDLTPFLDNIDCLLNLYQQLSQLGLPLKQINVGGGLGITYQHEQPPAIQVYAKALEDKLAGYPIELVIEPGRAIVGNAGVLLTSIEYLKHTHHKNFAIVDAGMNDLIRPALYDAWQNILPLEKHDFPKKSYDIAGPVCESSDFLGKNRELALQAGDILAIDTTGAYGFSMSSNYNSRPRPPEILVDDDKTFLIRKRESIEDLFAGEILLGDHESKVT